MGVWALNQARDLLRAGMPVLVVSFTPWLPRRLGSVGFKPAWTLCPHEHEWEGGVRVRYPRWLNYPAPGLPMGYRRPAIPAALCWRSGRAALRRAADEFAPDAVYCHHTTFNGFMARELKEERGLPYVLTDHAFSEVTDCERFPGRRAMYERVLGDAFCYAAVTGPLEREVRRLFPGVRTQTVNNGVAAPPPELAGTPRPPELRGKAVLTSVGVWEPRKAMPLLVRAFARVAGKHPHAVLRIAGDGPDRPGVDAAIRECGMEGRVMLTGLLPHARVLQEMAWCDAFVLISWSEPFATVFLEAAAAGRACIWASNGGIAEVLKDGVHGLHVAPKDLESAAAAIDRLLSDPEGRARMGRAALELHRSRLTGEANARALRALFEEAIASRRGPARHSAEPRGAPSGRRC